MQKMKDTTRFKAPALDAGLPLSVATFTLRIRGFLMKWMFTTLPARCSMAGRCAARRLCLPTEPNHQGSGQEDASHYQKTLAESHDERRNLYGGLQGFVGMFHRCDWFTPLLIVLSRLRIKEALYLQTVTGNSFSDPKIVKLFPLGDHRAKERRTHASTEVARNVKKSGTVTLLFPPQPGGGDG
jgi:hypothetical protein